MNFEQKYKEALAYIGKFVLDGTSIAIINC